MIRGQRSDAGNDRTALGVSRLDDLWFVGNQQTLGSYGSRDVNQEEPNVNTHSEGESISDAAHKDTRQISRETTP